MKITMFAVRPAAMVAAVDFSNAIEVMLDPLGSVAKSPTVHS